MLRLRYNLNLKTFRGCFDARCVCSAWLQTGQLRRVIVCFVCGGSSSSLLTPGEVLASAGVFFWRPKSRLAASGPAGCDAEPAAGRTHHTVSSGSDSSDWTELRESAGGQVQSIDFWLSAGLFLR